MEFLLKRRRIINENSDYVYHHLVRNRTINYTEDLGFFSFTNEIWGNVQVNHYLIDDYSLPCVFLIVWDNTLQ